MTRIANYQEAQEFMSKARKVEMGRPLLKGSWRMYADGDEYFTTAVGREVLRYTPDNRLILTLDPAEYQNLSHTMSACLYRVSPIGWIPVTHYDKRVYMGSSLSTKTEAFEGLTADLNTGTWLNPRPPRKERVDPDARKEWLRCVKAWKLNLKVKVRIGALEPQIEHALAVANPWDYGLHWNQQELDTLAESIKLGVCDNATTLLLIRSAKHDYYRSGKFTGQEVYIHAEKLLSKHSVGLRQRFNVFTGE